MPAALAEQERLRVEAGETARDATHEKVDSRVAWNAFLNDSDHKPDGRYIAHMDRLNSMYVSIVDGECVGRLSVTSAMRPRNTKSTKGTGLIGLEELMLLNHMGQQTTLNS